MSKHSRSKRVIQQGKDAVQPANETEGLHLSRENKMTQRAKNNGGEQDG